MKNNNAIPEGYMMVGEVAKKMGVSVCTLQYYDKKGLLPPSLTSQGGRRLYSYKDVVQLHQILSLKHLGFSLYDIKDQLFTLDTPSDVAKALTEQAHALQNKISAMSETLKDIKALQWEVLQMQTVDFKKYADIIVNLQMKNEFYWLIKYLDDKTLEHFRNHFNKDSALTTIETYTRLNNEATQLQKDGVLPESEEGIKFAKEFWNMVMEFTGGNMDMLSNLMELRDIGPPHHECEQEQGIAHTFIALSLSAYFATLDYNPLEEAT